MKEEIFGFLRESTTQTWFSISSPRDGCHLQVLQRGITKWWIQHHRIKFVTSPFSMIFFSRFFFSLVWVFWFCVYVRDLIKVCNRSWMGLNFLGYYSKLYCIEKIVHIYMVINVYIIFQYGDFLLCLVSSPIEFWCVMIMNHSVCIISGVSVWTSISDASAAIREFSFNLNFSSQFSLDMTSGENSLMKKARIWNLFQHCSIKGKSWIL